MSNEKKLQGTMKFSKEEELSILAEAQAHGVQVTLAKLVYIQPHFTTGRINYDSKGKRD